MRISIEDNLPDVVLSVERRVVSRGMAARAGLEAAGQELLEYAQEITSGPLDERTLRALGHPYAAARPNMAAMWMGHPGWINIQSGELYRSWSVEVHEASGGVSLGIKNTSPTMRWLGKGGEGVGAMVFRPLRELLQAEAERIVPRIIRRAMSAQTL